MNLPETINILGNIYTIIPCKTMLEVDPVNRSLMFGNIDLHSRVIRVFVGNETEFGKRTDFDTYQTLLHEILHGITVELHFQMDDDTTDTLATVILDTFIRNDLLK
jgi:hypothetical protein